MGWYHYQAAEDGTPGEKIECPDGTCTMKEYPAPAKQGNTSIAVQQNEEEEEELYEASGTIYHLCQKSLWLEAVEKGKPYFPPTFMKDGKFTRFSCERDTLVETANHYYGSFPGDWLCLSVDATEVRNRGVPIVAQRAPESTKQEPIQCLKVYSGVGVGQAVLEIHRMRRDEHGRFFGMIVDTVTPKVIMDRNAPSKAVKESSKVTNDTPKEQPLPKKETKVGGFFTMKKLRK
ncbi:hypothetical protein FisN_15Lh041 [Fistulifera solaris]|uniref:Uncharacterized protein n=1 Tax=Fistulifera solaris TaxID=1519565 RepID=A0A1Z5KHV8_FISSO|nr:hypothetical protein FisN_15Lh041 [Fistulifera solaris]|eukprot:GAX25672.1 hypothetical protein FisN_15Lh041 [Fistulifera solaris]